MAGSGGNPITFYEGDSGEIHLGRCGEEAFTFQAIRGTDQPRTVGPATSEFWFESGRGSTEYGLRPRKVVVCFEAGAAPADLEENTNYDVIVFSANVFNGIGIRQEVSYQGGNAIVVGKKSEDIYPGI